MNVQETKNTISVLIVEDDSSHAELMLRALESDWRPFRIRIASTTSQAVLMIAEEKPALMIVDHFLPDGVSGSLIAVAQGVFPVIVLTAQSHDRLAVQAIKTGAQDYFSKSPEVFSTIPDIVVRALREWQLIVDKKFTERKLSETERWRKDILDTAADGFWLVDCVGHILEANETYSRMSGYSKEELNEMTIFDFEVLEVENNMFKHLERIIIERQDRFETRHRRKDGSIFDVEISVQYRNIQGGRFICFLHDITERKKGELHRELMMTEMKKMLEQVKELKMNDPKCSTCELAFSDIRKWSSLTADELNDQHTHHV